MGDDYQAGREFTRQGGDWTDSRLNYEQRLGAQKEWNDYTADRDARASYGGGSGTSSGPSSGTTSGAWSSTWGSTESARPSSQNSTTSGGGISPEGLFGLPWVWAFIYVEYRALALVEPSWIQWPTFFGVIVAFILAMIVVYKVGRLRGLGLCTCVVYASFAWWLASVFGVDEFSRAGWALAATVVSAWLGAGLALRHKSAYGSSFATRDHVNRLRTKSARRSAPGPYAVPDAGRLFIAHHGPALMSAPANPRQSRCSSTGLSCSATRKLVHVPAVANVVPVRPVTSCATPGVAMTAVLLP